VTTVTTARTETGAGHDGADPFRGRLLEALAESIESVGYRDTTVADVVRRARTSRRTFYEHFASKEAAYVALLTDANTRLIAQITAAVDHTRGWDEQVRQAVEAWITGAQAAPAITVSWIRDLPSLGDEARRLQRESTAAFVTMLLTLWDSDEWRAIGVTPVSRQLAITLIGGLRELIATTVEDGGQIDDITEAAVRASLALLGAA
jgi:AcrR family transcriptional regulator